MRAMALTEFGDPDVLSPTDVDDPTPGPDTVVVEVRAAGVNPVDHKIVGGHLQGAFPHFLPLVPGWDVAGVVTAVGPAVQEWAVGDEVVGYARHDHLAANGTYAELVSAHPRMLARKPASMSWAAAAGLPLAGLTALQSMRLAGVDGGDVVLVHNAAGGVGTMAVQLAVAQGATVIGTASEGNHDHLRALGAIPVEYGEGLVDRVRDVAPGPVTAALAYIGTDEAVEVSVQLLADPSRLVSITDGAKATAAGGRYAFVRPQADDLAALSAMVDQGALRVDVAETFGLADASAALRRSQDGHVRGKLALAVS